MIKTTARTALLLCGLTGVKLVLLFWSGPLFTPDTAGYLAAANQILAGTLSDPGLDRLVMPPTVFRVLGYPALLAGAQTLVPITWPWLVVGLQIMGSLVATVVVMKTARAWGWGAWACLAIATVQSLSLPLTQDQTLLTDSLNSSLVTVASCLLVQAALAVGRPSLRTILAAGLCLGLAFFLREMMQYLIVAFLPLAAMAGWRGADGRGRGRGAVVAVILVALPTLVAVQAYKAWNQQRLGVSVVTTGAQTTALQALAATRDPAVFAGDTPLDRAARATFRHYDFDEVVAIDRHLFETGQGNSIKRAADALRAYRLAWWHHPGAMLGVVLRHMRVNQTQLVFCPVEALRLTHLYAAGDTAGFPRWRHPLAAWWHPLALVLDALAKAGATIVFAAFALGIPWRLIRGPRDREAALFAAVWLAYFTVLAAYAAVHLETRYMAGVVPVSLLGGLAVLRCARHVWRPTPIPKVS